MTRSLGTQLRRLVDALDGAVDAAYAEHGIVFRARFYPLFRLLLEQDCLGVGDLARRAKLSQPAVTQTLKLMREAGLVDLVEAADRRERRYRLSAAGQALGPRLRPIWIAVERAAARLDQALPAPLGETVQAALDQLSQVPFHRMIGEELRGANDMPGGHRRHPDDSPRDRANTAADRPR